MTVHTLKSRSIVTVVGVIGLVLLAAGYLLLSFGCGQTQPVLATASAGQAGIACLGRLEPEDGVCHLAAPFSMQGPSIIAELLVREGDHVTSNQVLAVTSNYRTFQADYEMAESLVKVSQGKLKRIQSGEKQGDIAAQAAELQRAEVELANARSEFKRDEEILRIGGISQTGFDRSRLIVETRNKEVERAREKLNSIKEIREVDIDPAQHELAVALASARRAEAELNRTQVRAPFAGQVIKVHARPGEEVGRDGVLELAKTDSMFAHAEVYETDIHRVRPGQRAEISGDAFPGKVSGRVESVGMKIGKNDVLKTDPAAYADARVVEVKIRLEDSQRVAALIHAQVDVQIFP